MIFKKMGHQGWEGIVPFYNTYVLCQELYGSGWKFLLLLIPLYNIYFVIKMQIDLAKAFNQGAGFGIGLLLFVGCDVCVGLHNLTGTPAPLAAFAQVGMWLFYLPSQVLIVLSIPKE